MMQETNTGKTIQSNIKKKEFMSCRDVLWVLVFCGFAVNYMLRINLNLTIVAMVVLKPKAAASVQCEARSVHSLWKNETFHYNTSISTTPSPATLLPDLYDHGNRFTWNEYEQGLVLGAYYWLHWLSQLPGGLLARRFGTKCVFGMANFLTAIIGFLIPWATQYHLYALVFLRVLQGLIAGVIWPSMHDMTAKWIPLDERSRFVSAYLGSSVGAAITYPFCAFVSNWIGWQAAFHMTSAIGVIWYCFWYFLVYDSPQDHPRISNDEKSYIIDNLAKSVDEQPAQVPWRAILTSKAIWVTTAAHWGSAWGFLTLMTQAPSYFRYIHGWDINATGLLSGAPHLLRMGFSYAFSTMSDWLLRTNRMSLTNVRKLATFVCTGLQGILILSLGLSGCHPTAAVAFMMIGTAVNGAISASTLATFVDLAPNYASVLLGFAGLVTVNGSYISPLIVGVLTNNNQTVNQWRSVYIIAAANSIIGYLIYQLYGTSKEQPWNRYGDSSTSSGQELKCLKVKNENEKAETETDKFIQKV